MRKEHKYCKRKEKKEKKRGKKNTRIEKKYIFSCHLLQSFPLFTTFQKIINHANFQLFKAHKDQKKNSKCKNSKK